MKMSLKCDSIASADNGNLQNQIGIFDIIQININKPQTVTKAKTVGNDDHKRCDFNNPSNSSIRSWNINTLQIPSINQTDSFVHTGAEPARADQFAKQNGEILKLLIKGQQEAQNNARPDKINSKDPIEKALKPKTVYVCPKCKKTFQSGPAFESHYRESYGLDPIYACQLCEKQLKTRRSYQEHCHRHLKELKCPICSKTFTQEKMLNQHNTAIHNLSTAKQCSDCDREFFDLHEYKTHCQIHCDQKRKERKWECTECGKMMKNRSSLNMHKKIHRNDRQFACLLCDQKFIQKINLINHVKSHNDIKPHSCNKCGKSFVGESQLVRHYSYHTNVRSFECDVCKKMYKSKRDLRLHRMIHSIQRPHKCSNCEKTFLSTSKLKQHLNIHTGLRPFKCKYCSKDFTNFPNWLKHTRRRHKVDHKTGEQLAEMPKFLKKQKKKVTPEEDSTPQKVEDVDTLTLKVEKMGHTESVNSKVAIDDHLKDTPANISTSQIENAIRLKQNIDASEMLIPSLEEMMMYPLTHPIVLPDTDLSTITVNDKTLPLNTSDDLERAASLLMQQTLDMEDEVEFIAAKSEPLDSELYPGQIYFGQDDHLDYVHDNFEYTISADVMPSHLDNNMLMSPIDESNFYPFYPSHYVTLPPINTVKSALNRGAAHSFSSTANVL